ncbi:hypothetical protein BZL43_21195 [Pseudomonas sp. PICF141]|nr:hypothetical protein BZL43_21195 [Pseudomonas sp. PICF141]
MPVSQELHNPCGSDLWRGGLPPLGCEAAPKSLSFQNLVSATLSNGGKPPRHRVPQVALRRN